MIESIIEPLYYAWGGYYQANDCQSNHDYLIVSQIYKPSPFFNITGDSGRIYKIFFLWTGDMILELPPNYLCLLEGLHIVFSIYLERRCLIKLL